MKIGPILQCKQKYFTKIKKKSFYIQFSLTTIMSEPLDLNGYASSCKVLERGNGAIVYLIGTNHASETSANEVADLIRNVQPDFVVLELCEGRAKLLYQDEQTLTEGLQGSEKGFTLDFGSNLRKMYKSISKLEILPGREFRVAYEEAKKIPGCEVLLGDIPSEMTVEKMNRSLTLWMKFKMALFILFLPIIIWFILLFYDKERVRREFENLEQEEEEGDMESLLLEGRDEFLAHSLMKAADKMVKETVGKKRISRPPNVVGVVGAAHLPGIEENWNVVTEEDIEEILASYGSVGETFDINRERVV